MADNLKLAYSAAVNRRQLFLIRCLGGSAGKKNFNFQSIRMQSVMSSGPSLEADAVSILRSIIPGLESTKHKGQAGETSFRFLFTCIEMRYPPSVSLKY